MSIEVGAAAPNFKLFSSDKAEVQLSDYRGKNVVVLFFPLAFTGVCTAELCDMRDNMHKYQSLNAQILAISVDSPFTLAKFKEENAYNFPLLSDFNAKTAKKYDAIYKDFVLGMKNVARRAAFVVDAKGVVRYAEVLESAGDLPNFKAIQEVLATLN